MKLSSMIVGGLLLAVASSTPAHAGEFWDEGATVNNTQACVQGAIPGAESFVGYVNNNAPPRTTGDIQYVHAVVRYVGCLADDVKIELFLPTGAVVTTNASMPVLCFKGTIGDTNAPQAAWCQQTPIIGPNNGLVFMYGFNTQQQQNVPAFTTLGRQEFLEVMVPVTYTAPLTGSGPTQTMGAVVTSTYNPPNTAMIPTKPVTVAYQAQVHTHSSTNITSTSAKTTFWVNNYYVGGTAVVEYGTDAWSLGPTATSPISVPSNGWKSELYQSIAGLQPNTIYFWRVRFQTASGTYYGTIQQLETAPITLSIALAGNGQGHVISNWTGIDCGNGNTKCSSNIPYGATVTLTPMTRTPYVFKGWSGGGCSGTGLCKVTMTANTTVTAIFDYGTPTPLPGEPPPRR